MEAFKYCMEIESSTDLNSASSEQFSDFFFRQSNNAGETWENPGPFESALSSIVSSPAKATNSGAGDGFAIRELIGRLGNICNSGGENSANNSCYATPLNSPPKLNLSMPPPPFSGDPGFAERAVKNSLFALADQFGDSREGSSVSDQIMMNPIPAENASTTRKRKSAQRSKASVPKQPEKVAAENEETKRNKRDGDSSEEKKEIAKPPQEAPKDYIHVRARRGQATDSHSLAERVRREKIGERMKFLQDLVPGCNKVTGKAVMLDEIINYVQSLQRQVEFLSMKLATVNPRTDFNMEALLSKDIFQSRGSLPHGIYPLDASALHSFPFGYHHQSQQLDQQLHNNSDHTQTQFQVNPQLVHRTPSIQLAASDGFAEPADQVSTFFGDDLQSVVQMGFEGSMASGQMKVEL